MCPQYKNPLSPYDFFLYLMSLCECGIRNQKNVLPNLLQHPRPRCLAKHRESIRRHWGLRSLDCDTLKRHVRLHSRQHPTAISLSVDPTSASNAARLSCKSRHKAFPWRIHTPLRIDNFTATVIHPCTERSLQVVVYLKEFNCIDKGVLVIAFSVAQQLLVSSSFIEQYNLLKIFFFILDAVHDIVMAVNCSMTRTLKAVHIWHINLLTGVMPHINGIQIYIYVHSSFWILICLVLYRNVLWDFSRWGNSYLLSMI